MRTILHTMLHAALNKTGVTYSVYVRFKESGVTLKKIGHYKATQAADENKIFCYSTRQNISKYHARAHMYEAGEPSEICKKCKKPYFKIDYELHQFDCINPPLGECEVCNNFLYIEDMPRHYYIVHSKED